MTVPPKKLYKYCPINVYSMRAITQAEVHHTSPALFNDPLDCHPTIEVDAKSPELEQLLATMMNNQLIGAEHIRTEIGQARHMADLSSEADRTQYENQYTYYLANSIHRYLSIELGVKGVQSLSETCVHPLMWSHYADHHKGICIEYEVPQYEWQTLKKVNYNAPRAIRAHDLFQWKCENDPNARDRVMQTYFYSKAPEWSYEQEWRDVNDKAGPHPLAMNLSAIYFGLRTDIVWQRALTKLLNQDRDVAIYQMRAESASFGLSFYGVDRDELEGRGIDQPPFKVFGRILETSRPRDDFDDLLLSANTAESSGVGKTLADLFGAPNDNKPGKSMF